MNSLGMCESARSSVQLGSSLIYSDIRIRNLSCTLHVTAIVLGDVIISKCSVAPLAAWPFFLSVLQTRSIISVYKSELSQQDPN